MTNGRKSWPVPWLGFKPSGGRQTILGGFDSHFLPPCASRMAGDSGHFMNVLRRVFGSKAPPPAAPDAFERAMVASRLGDDASARRLFDEAAQAGEAAAGFNLAVLLDKGRGGPVDMAGAVKWYRVAAEGGDLDAQLRLAVMLEHGIGAPAQMSAALP